MADKKKKSGIKYWVIAFAVIYFGLFIFPLRVIYDFRDIGTKEYNPRKNQAFEVTKRFMLLPGPPSLWALLTPEGYDVCHDMLCKDKRVVFLDDKLAAGVSWVKTLFTPTNELKNATVSEHKIFQFDNFDPKEWFLGGFEVSPDKRRIAFLDRKEGKRCVNLDGVQGPAYPAIFGDSLQFSPDSKRVAYLVRDRKKGKWFYVVDGVEQKHYDKIVFSEPLFSNDSRRIAYGAKLGDKWFAVVDGVESIPYDASFVPFFSPDSKRVAYQVKTENQAFMVVDGQAGQTYEVVSRPIFSPDCSRLAYYVKSGDRFAVVVDGIEGKYYDFLLRFPVFSPDGKQIAYVARQGAKYFAVVDGIEQKAYDYDADQNYDRYILKGSPVFSPDSARLAYKIEADGKEFLVVDGIEGKRYNRIDHFPVFSPDSQHIAYHAISDQGGTVVVDDQEQTPRKGAVLGFPVRNLILPAGLRWSIFSPDSRRTAYGLRIQKSVKSTSAEYIVDDQVMGRHDKFKSAVFFSPDSQRAAYIAGDGDKDVVVVEGMGKLTYDMAGLVGSGLAFDDDNRFHFMALKDKGVYLVEVKLNQ